MSGLFSTFNVATRGMSAQQKAIDVTSHNIANANTVGYTRQRASMETTRPFTEANGSGQLGTGVQVSTITRIRDTYLDYQVRTENGTMGLYEGREEFLAQVEGVFNEPSDTGVSSLIGKLFDSWSSLSTSADTSNARTVVAQQSKALTDELNSTYNQLVTLKKNSQDVIKQSVIDINNMLDQIDELNKQVMSVKVSGNEPNDLMDKRDLLVDELSLKFGITIDKKALSGEDLSATQTGDMENAYLVSSDPAVDEKRFSYVSSIEEDTANPGTYTVTYYKNGDMSSDDNKVTMSMELSDEEYAELDQGRVLWADNEGNAIDASGDATGTAIEVFKPDTGELAGYRSAQEDIDGYIDQLNSLAKAITFSINAVHSGESDAETGTDVLNFFVNSDDTSIAGETGITAGNITVNEAILDDVMLINAGAGAGNTDGNRALAISQLRDTKLLVQSIDGDTTRAEFLDGKFADDATLGVDTVVSDSNGTTIEGYFTDTVNRLAIQAQEATRITTNHEALLASLEESRASVSGVSLDEEMANLIQFQHAYQANAKIISTVDELLDLIINGLKR